MIIGIFAHVDSGKTTLSESILYKTHVTRNLLSVDDKTSILDSDELERKSKITIYSSIIDFNINNHKYYLVDTPGHADFVTELEASIYVVDVVVLLVSINKKISESEKRIFRLAKKFNKKIIILLTKIDLVNYDKKNRIKEIEHELTSDIINLSSPDFIDLLLLYNENVTKNNYEITLKELLSSNELIPLLEVSASKDKGVDEFLNFLDTYYYETKNKLDKFKGVVFKKEYYKNELYTYLKVLSGKIKVKDEINLIEDDKVTRKVSNIYEVSKNFKQVTESSEDIVVLKGVNPKLFSTIEEEPKLIKDFLTKALFRIKLQINSKISLNEAYLRLLKYSDIDSGIKISLTKDSLYMDISGELKKDIVKEKLLSDFDLDIDYLDSHVILKETVSTPVIGFGHYEPLRHYGEVKLRLAPSDKEGISFTSRVPFDKLSETLQNEIRHYVLDFPHLGILTGSPLTNVEVTLMSCATSEKHTVGGDIYESTRRAMRQAQCHAVNDILEPFLKCKLELDNTKSNLVIEDLKALRVRELDIRIEDRTTLKFLISARDLNLYYQTLLNKTSNNFILEKEFYKYLKSDEPCLLTSQVNYDFESDLDNPADSIFCAHGAGFLVKWYDVDKYRHLD